MCTERPVCVSMRGEDGRVYELTSGSIKTAPAAIALEVLRLLVRDEDLEVVEVALAVETPWSLELLVQIRVPLPFFRHDRECSSTRVRIYWFGDLAGATKVSR